MVVSCERSPHSARKVRVKAWMKMGEMKLCHFPWGTVVPDAASTSGDPLSSLDRWSWTQNYRRLRSDFTKTLGLMLYLHNEISWTGHGMFDKLLLHNSCGRNCKTSILPCILVIKMASLQHQSFFKCLADSWKSVFQQFPLACASRMWSSEKQQHRDRAFLLIKSLSKTKNTHTEGVMWLLI